MNGIFPRLLIFSSWFIFPVLLFSYGLDEYSLSNKLIAASIFLVATFPLFSVLRGNHAALMLVLVMVNYLIFFVFPIFHESALDLFYGTIRPEDGVIDKTLLIVLFAVCFIQVGFFAAGKFLGLFPVEGLKLKSDNTRLFLFAITIIVASIYLFSVEGDVSPTLFKLYMVVFSADLGVAILSLLFYEGKLNLVQKWFALGTLALLIGVGFAGGSTQTFVQPLAIWFIARWLVTGKVPAFALVLCFVFIVVVQPVKNQFRAEAWYGRAEIGMVEAGLLYIDLIEKHWFTETEDVDLGNTSRRMSLLLQTSHVVKLTPSKIPFQGADSLLYPVYGLIPRIIWKDKPIAQKINIWFADEYDISTKRGIEKARFGIGHPGEAYISFGMVGLPFIFFMLGVMYYLPLHFLTHSKSGWRRKASAALADLRSLDPGLKGILIVLLIQNMVVGSSVGNVFGAVAQQLVVQYLLLLIFAGKGLLRTRASVPAAVGR